MGAQIFNFFGDDMTNNKKNEQKFLTELINDERNSALFYAHLSTLAQKTTIRAALEDIAVECGMNVNMLLVYCRSIGISPDENFGNIEKNISLSDGLEWAVEVEKESMGKLRSKNGIKPYKAVYDSKKKRLPKLENCVEILVFNL